MIYSMVPLPVTLSDP